MSGGLVWTGGYSIGDATAALRGNAVGRHGAAVHAVSTRSRRSTAAWVSTAASAFAVDARR